MSDELDDVEDIFDDPFGDCEVCGDPLLQRGGYAGLGMCGPCTTGEADMIGEITEEN